MKNQTSVQEEPKLYFKVSGGVTLFATKSEFEKNWKSHILSRGETYSVEEIAADLDLATFDQILEDRAGRLYSAWYVYHYGRVVMVQFTIGGMNTATQLVNFEVLA